VTNETSRQEALESRLQQILQRTDFPALAEHIQELMLRISDEESSLRHVTNVILKDMGLALRVLRTANSAQYNRSGKPILTVAHAAALLGLEALRNMTTSLLLFRHYQTRSPGTKQLMLLGLLTANHARETSEMVGYPRWEEAYLCGMFRNLGEVLLACYFPEDYARILATMKEKGATERPACLEVAGCTYEELGRAAAQHWNMPDRAISSMAPAPQVVKPRSEAEWLSAVTSFSHELTSAVHRMDPDGARARVNHLLQVYGPGMGLAREQIQKIADRAIIETKATFDMLRMPLDDLRLRKQTETALETAFAKTAAVEPAAPAAAQEMPAGEALIERIAQEVQSVSGAGGELDLNHVLLMILEGLYRGGGFDRVLFCLVSPDHTTVQARLGLGEGIDELLGKFQFPISRQAPPIAASLLAKRDLFVHDGRYAGSGFVQVTGANCFGIYPVVVSGVLVGCIYFDRRSPEAPLSAALKAGVGRLRDLAATAIGIKRKGSGGCAT